jgi:glutamine synthetase
VSLSPTDPVRACDEAVLFKLLASWLAEEQGLRASFSPQPFLDTIGNGQHLHFSLWSGCRNLFAARDGSMDPRGEAFLAGVLEHLPALTGLGACSPVSFLRLRPSQWSGAFACWGPENREAALRLEGADTGRPGAVNVEWKSVDGSANAYLALGGVLAAGLDGLHRDMRLPPPVLGDPADLSEPERHAQGIRTLPRSLEEAARSLDQCRILQDALGTFLHGCVVAIRASEGRSAANEDALVNDYRFRY